LLRLRDLLLRHLEAELPCNLVEERFMSLACCYPKECLNNRRPWYKSLQGVLIKYTLYSYHPSDTLSHLIHQLYILWT